MKTRYRVLIDEVTHVVYEQESIMFAGKTACLVLFTVRGHAEFLSAKATWRDADCMTCLVAEARIGKGT